MIDLKNVSYYFRIEVCQDHEIGILMLLQTAF